jgi:hypothetical protein
MQILSKNVLLMEALKNQNAYLIKFDLKKNISYSAHRYNLQIVPEMIKIFPEHVLNEAEIRVLYQEEFIIKKYERYEEAIKIWEKVPKTTKILENEIINDYFIIECSLLDKEGLEIKNNKQEI